MQSGQIVMLDEELESLFGGNASLELRKQEATASRVLIASGFHFLRPNLTTLIVPVVSSEISGTTATEGDAEWRLSAIHRR